MFQLPDITAAVAGALAEDLGVAPDSLFESGGAKLLSRDVTSFGTLGDEGRFGGLVVSRQACVVAGLPVAAAVYELLSDAAGLFEPIELFPLVAEGTSVDAGTPVAEVEGLAAAVLAGERTALNFMMLLSGIATETARWVRAAGEMQVADTRKTLPGLRALSKYAVRVGGGTNHRTGLYDMALVKDNHLAAVSIEEAVLSLREIAPTVEIEIEADTIEQAVAIVDAGADAVLLDNMDDETLTVAVAACRAAAERKGSRCIIEASGGIEFERLAGLRKTGVDRVSSSALTLARPVDFGFDEQVSARR